MAVLTTPGQGIVHPGTPNTQFQEYPKHMRHPGFRPGVADKEIKVLDENGTPTGRVVFRGGQSIRFPPVLVRSRASEEEHAAQGYETVGPSSEEAFRRAVATPAPSVTDYVPIEYPKWCHGMMVIDAVEEEERLRELGIDKEGRPLPPPQTSSEPAAAEPALTAKVHTAEHEPEPVLTEEEEIAALEARLAALKAKNPDPVILAQPEEPIKAGPFGRLAKPATPPMSDAEAKKVAKSKKIKEGLARRREKQEAARLAAARAEDAA